MSAVGAFDLRLNLKYIFPMAFSAFVLAGALSVHAEPTIPSELNDTARPQTIDALLEHAGTIADLLETASERVERMAAAEVSSTVLLQAIRQELTLSRRWNRHLGAILLDVAEARQALGERERKAAREIARMTAVAEEARRELVALKQVLKGKPAEMLPGSAGEVPDRWSESRHEGADARSVDTQLASRGRDVEPLAGIDEMRARLASIQAAEASTLRDVDSVRGKIMEALQTLADARGDAAFMAGSAGDTFSSADITGWAASIATRLERSSDRMTD